VQYRGNVLLWPKSDESKKSLVFCYLFTLWSIVFSDPKESKLRTGTVVLTHMVKTSVSDRNQGFDDQKLEKKNFSWKIFLYLLQSTYS
jgi:hypothetical protein